MQTSNQLTYEIVWSDNAFWLIQEDKKGVYQEQVTTFRGMDEIGNSEKHLWALQYKGKINKNWEFSSAKALRLQALIPHIRTALTRGDSVRVLTPDLIVQFYKG